MTQRNPYLDPYSKPINTDLISIQLLAQYVLKPVEEADKDLQRLAGMRLEALTLAVDLPEC